MTATLDRKSPARDEAFHAGERALQERAGVRGPMAHIGPKVIRDHMPEQHRVFFSQLPFVLIGGLDRQGWPWASVLAGAPGFLESPDDRTLQIHASPTFGDPLHDALEVGADIALLGIELSTRRRNRVSGVVLARGPDLITVGVKQSFGNCPKYIQRREHRAVARTSAPAVRAEGAALSDGARAWIERADTFFIASATGNVPAADRSSGVDVSHRGGKPGFVRVRSTAGHTELVFPDFSGNFFFNTLGNIALFPRAGLLFLDFVKGDLLLLRGDAEVLWTGADLAAYEGAERLVRVAVQSGVWLEGALPFSFTAPAFARELASTGDWPDHDASPP